MYTVCLMLNLLRAASTARAGPSVPSDGFERLSRADGRVEATSDIEVIRRERMPATAAYNGAAHRPLRRARQSCLIKFERRFHAYLVVPAGADPHRSPDYARIVPDTFALRALMRRTRFRHRPQSAARTLCVDYPAAMEGDLSPDGPWSSTSRPYVDRPGFFENRIAYERNTYAQPRP